MNKPNNMSILYGKQLSKYHNYIKTKWWPGHILIFQRYQNMQYSKYKNLTMHFGGYRIPTSLGFIDIEHTHYYDCDCGICSTTEIAMVFHQSTVRVLIIHSLDEKRIVDEEYLTNNKIEV